MFFLGKTINISFPTTFPGKPLIFWKLEKTHKYLAGYHVFQAGLELLTLLPLFSEYWDYGHVHMQPAPASVVAFTVIHCAEIFMWLHFFCQLPKKHWKYLKSSLFNFKF